MLRYLKLQYFLAPAIAVGIGSIAVLSFMDANEETKLEAVQRSSQQPVRQVELENPCAAPAMPFELCAWNCDDVATECVQVESVGETECFECQDRRPAACEAPALAEDDCLRTCNGECEFAYFTQERERCSTCEEVITCTLPAFSTKECPQHCNDGECVYAYDASDGSTCSVCERAPAQAQPKEVCTSDEYDGLRACEAACDGTCIETADNCYQCLKCPAGTYKTDEDCSAQCDSNCNIKPSTNSISCWECPKSCDTICEERGYEAARSYHDDVWRKLQSETCVSGVSISLIQGNINGCDCTGTPEVEINRDVPVCTSTACGAVACGESATCTIGEVERTVNCLWKGWLELGEYEYQAQIRAE